MPSAREATPTDTGGSYSVVSPVNLGNRLLAQAENYNQYRINFLKMTYKPCSFTQLESLAIGVAQSYQIAAGFLLDPTRGVLTPENIVMSGGRSFSLDRPQTFTLKSTKWLFVDPVGSDAADVRWYSPGNFYCVQYKNGGTPQKNYGVWECSWDISFRYPVDPGQDGSFNAMTTLKDSFQRSRQFYESKQESREQNPGNGPNGLLVNSATSGISMDVEAKSDSFYSSAAGDSPIILPPVQFQSNYGVVQKPPQQTPRPKLVIDVGKVKK